MLTLGDSSTDGAFLRFDWSDDSFDDASQEHTTPAAPIVECYDGILVPLALERRHQLTPEEVIRAVIKGRGGMPPPLAIDWLGLALYAARRFLEAMGKLATANTPEHQAEILAADILRHLMDKIYNRMAGALYVELRNAGCWEQLTRAAAPVANGAGRDRM